MSFELGFDIGGTFTDFALLNRDSGELEIFKALTTPERPEVGALEGLATFLASCGLRHEEPLNLFHGTTLVANTLIEQKGALVGTLTTAGFRDVLEMRTEQRYAIYDLFLQYPPPLSPRYLRRGIKERIDRDGNILEPVREKDVRRAVADFKREGVEAIAVACLHSYRNPANERRIAEIVRAEWPDVPLALSSEVAPEIREYERTSTTVANAYTLPLMSRYLKTLDDQLAEAGFGGNLFLMLSSGSSALAGAARSQPIRLVESGPAAGALAAAYFGELAGHQDLISFDMGGTTAKVALVHDGAPAAASHLEAARVHRFTKGSGYPLQFPTVDILESGAGGGSIAWVDQLGLLKVGPQSAGSDPGPACYGFGGRLPTVTDADLVLGYLNPEYFLGGAMALDRSAAEGALQPLAETFAWTIVETASAIHQLVNENMAAAARIHILESGRDPRNYAMVCFGGAGPAHAAGVAEILGVREVIVAPGAGVASALGLLIAPIAFDYSHSHPTPLASADWRAVSDLFAEMEAQGRRMLRAAGIAEAEMVIERGVDGRFQGQLHEIQVPLPADFQALALDDFRVRFKSRYRELYHYVPDHSPIELLTWRVRVSGARKPMQSPRLPEAGADPAPAAKGQRRAYFSERADFVETPVYDRYRLGAGMTFPGPAIIEERESTIVLRPGMWARADAFGNVHLVRARPAKREGG
ncbi:MAG: hydantoinase/oxoprolinase family protein [Chloroflexi bacterium]|nr:hydantoinase/oxoprolinase family protein [Chloroflexota bacterium]